MTLNIAKLGDRVQVRYVGLFKDGIPMNNRPEAKVLEFTVGSAEVMPGLSLGVVGMAEGQQKRLTLQPKVAYGTVRRELIKEVPRQRFPAHLDLRVGKRLTSVGATSGRRRKVRIVEIKPDTVVVDGNHPLAGKILDVEVRLVSLVTSSADPGGAQYDAGGEG